MHKLILKGTKKVNALDSVNWIPKSIPTALDKVIIDFSKFNGEIINLNKISCLSVVYKGGK